MNQKIHDLVHLILPGTIYGQVLKHEMHYLNLHFAMFPMKFCYVYFNYYPCEIYVMSHWFVDRSKWSPIKTIFGNSNAVVSTISSSLLHTNTNVKNEYWIATTKLYSKSFKQMYMEWIYEKCLHNINVYDMTTFFTTACIRCPPPSYPVRPASKHRFESIGGFSQHPNSSANM